jgi:arsenate reductase
MLKIYLYDGCGSCRLARRWLESRRLECHAVPIREQPPAVEELAAMLAARDGRRAALCNTSGRDYRESGLGARMAGLSDGEFLAVLSSNGNLVKRPFVIDAAAGIFLCGFREGEWEAAFRR